MSNNFSGVQKSDPTIVRDGVQVSGSFKPQTRASDGAGVGKTVAGLWPGDSPVTVFEKAGPVLDTDKAPNSGHRGERELGVSVDRIDRDGGAEYTNPADIIRQTIARLSGVSGTSKAVSELTALLDRIDGNTGKASSGDMHKDAPANSVAALRKELDTLKENIRRILAQRAGAILTETGSNGSRFVTKDAGGNDPQQLLKHALDNGVAVPFSGADPRSAEERASGSGRRFQPK